MERCAGKAKGREVNSNADSATKTVSFLDRVRPL